MFCLEPLILAGYLFMIDPHRRYGTNLNAAMVEVQSCDRGIGINLKASQSGAYAAAAQYGFQAHRGDWSFTATPNLGVGYHDVQDREEQSKLTFTLGTQFAVGYRSARVAVEWWHMSNAHLGERNAGLDMGVVLAGWKF